MSRLKSAMLMLGILCCSSQVSCRPKSWVKSYTFRNQQLVIGINHIDRTTIAYALCEIDPFEQSGRCKVILQRNVFDDIETDTCTLDLATANPIGKIDHFRLELWGEDRVIFTWRDIDTNSTQRPIAVLQTINMTSCDATVYTVAIDRADNMQYSIFIVTDVNSLSAYFMNDDLCDNEFCKMTVISNSEVFDVERSFTKVGMTYAIDHIPNHDNRVVVSIEEEDENSDKVLFSLVTPFEIKILKKNNLGDDLGWSTSNDIILVCSIYECELFNYDGGSLMNITLRTQPELSEVMAFYNLPFGGYLAVACSSPPNNNYRFLKLNINGEQQFSYDMRGMKCSIKPDYLTVKIFMKSVMEYCVSLFQGIFSEYGWASYRMYCFTNDDMIS